MQKVSELTSTKIGDTLTNIRTWSELGYNVLNYGLKGDGVTDDTAALQALINKAIAEGRRTIFFPHGQYYVTSLTNADQVDFVGDNSTFVGGYAGTIGNMGGFAELQADYVPKIQGIPPISLSRATVTNNYTGVYPITFHDGYLYGVSSDGVIMKSDDDGNTWASVANSPVGVFRNMSWTNDGEVLLQSAGEIVKSSGWLINPATATWQTKVTKSSPSGVGIHAWGFDGDGTKYIATEYSSEDRSESRYVWISTDMGNNWSIVLDKTTIDPTNQSHMHGVCYDKWADRFFLSHGHGDIKGVYYSDDDGATWHKIGGPFQPDAAPTTLMATENGIVCGSDSNYGGLYGIARTDNPEHMEIKPLVRWYVDTAGVTGFACRSFRDEETGIVYVSFLSNKASVASVIMAGTATTGRYLWESPTKGTTNFEYLAKSRNKIIGIISRDGVNEKIEGYVSHVGVDTYDKGNIQGGVSNDSTSIAIGTNTVVNTSNEIAIGKNISINGSGTQNVVVGNNVKNSLARSVVIGSDSSGGVDSVVIGYGAVNPETSLQSVAIGKGAATYDSAISSVAIGLNAKAAINGVAIGANSDAGQAAGRNRATAIGGSAKAGVNGVSVGNSAQSGQDQVAIGYNAIANHSNSVALGKDVATTAANQVNIGARYIEMKKVADPTSLPVDTGRLFIKDNGSGKMQLCVRLGATIVVLATES